MMGWRSIGDGVVAGLLATTPLEAAGVVLGFAYSLLAIRRSRWCWVAGGGSAIILAYLALRAQLPMQAALQLFYVGVSVYGYWHWSQEEQSHGSVTVTTLPLRAHLMAWLAIAALSAVSGRWLAIAQASAWPMLDSLTTWSSLYATWLVARVKLENWLYWVFIDSLATFLFGAQGLYFIALLSFVYLGVSIAGFFRWLTTYRKPAAAT